MALRDLALSKSGDLLINESGDFTIIDSVRQGIQIKLRWIKGEWVFNPEMGVPYFESILVKTPNRALIEKTLRDQILSVPSVTINLAMDKKKRTLSAKFTAKTTEGEVESEVELSHGVWNNS